MSQSHFSAQPIARIRPPSAWPRVDLSELWAFRDLVLILGVRDLKLRYRQTALGVLWIVLQPLLAAGVFTFVFNQVAFLPSEEGIPYFVLSYSGMLAWNAFNSTMMRASSSLVSGTQLVSKVYFARLVLPVAVTLTALVDFVVGGTVLLLLLLLTGTGVTLQVLLLPVWLVPIVSLALGIGLIAGAAMVRYRDVNSLVSLMSLLLLYSSPIAYTSTAVPSEYRTTYFLNPLAGLLDAFRWSALGTQGPSAWKLTYACVAAFGLLAIGAASFKRMERNFADVI